MNAEPIALEATRNYRYEYVRVADLKIDTAYHAEERFNEQRARRMAAEFDENRLGVVTVSLRGESMWLIDGNHRRFAAAEVGLAYLYAKVYVGLTQAEEAAIFIGLSASVPLQTLDLWRARRVDGDPTVLGVERELERAGIRVVRGGASKYAGTTRAVAVLERIYRVDPALLSDVLGIIKAAWGDDGRSTDALPLQAVSSFLFCYRRTIPHVDERRLLDRMSMTPVAALYRAEQLQRANHGGTGRSSKAGELASVATYSTARNALLGIYNRGLHHKLPALNQSDIRAIHADRIADLRGRDAE